MIALTVNNSDEELIAGLSPVVTSISLAVGSIQTVVGPFGVEARIVSVNIWPVKGRSRKARVREGGSREWTVRVLRGNVISGWNVEFRSRRVVMAVLNKPDHVVLELPVVGGNGASTNSVTIAIIDNLVGSADLGMLGDDVVNVAIVVEADVILIGERNVRLSWNVKDGVAINEGSHPLLATNEVDTTFNVGAQLRSVVFRENSGIDEVLEVAVFGSLTN